VDADAVFRRWMSRSSSTKRKMISSVLAGFVAAGVFPVSRVTPVGKAFASRSG